MLGFLKKSVSAPESTPKNDESSSWLGRLKSGLSRTGSQLSGLFALGGKINDELYEELETILITSDVGMDATRLLLADVKRQVKESHLTEAFQLKEALAHSLLKLLKPLAVPLDVGNHQPFVIMLVGVNGAGKTTSIGKLARANLCSLLRAILFGRQRVSNCLNGGHVTM
jgi:fused signal recognition particle receptor